MESKNIVKSLSKSNTLKKDVTFVNAKTEKIHRWFPYLEGFSEKFISDILIGLSKAPKSIYEPFAGSGTLPIYAIANDHDIYYSEVNPFLQRLISIKIHLIQLDLKDRSLTIQKIDNLIDIVETKLQEYKLDSDLLKSYQKVFENKIYFSENNLALILKTKSLSKTIDNSYLIDVLDIAVCEALLHSSFLKRAGDIRYRKGSELNQMVDFDVRLIRNLKNIKSDLNELELLSSTRGANYFTPNAKFFDSKISNKIDVVITSPPYLNGTNYIRNTKLELWYLEHLKEKSDLGYYRRLVVTSGINDVSAEKKEINLPQLKKVLNDSNLWYDKRIPKMINDYFFDMKLVFENCYKYLKSDSYIFIDIGDSVYGGVHIKTDRILIDILEEVGFSYEKNMKLRERKSKGGQIVKQALIIAKKK